MPPKGRIDDEDFRRALCQLGTDQICLLDSSSTTASIWGDLCDKMNKANNPENRRACYDVWKRKRMRLQPFLDELLEKNTVKSTIQQCDSPPKVSDDLEELVDINKTIDETIENMMYTDQSSDLSKSPTTNRNEQFLKQLRKLVSQNGRTISIIEAHDHTSVVCSGDIIALQVVYQCSIPSEITDDEVKRSKQIDSSVDERHTQIDSSIDRNECSLQLQHSQNQSDFPSKECSPIHSPLKLHMSQASSTSVTASPTSNDDDLDSANTPANNPISNLVSHVKNLFSPPKSMDHHTLDDDQRDVLRFLQRRKSNDSMFTCDVQEIRKVEETKSAIVSQTHMDVLKRFREEHIGKKTNKKLSSDEANMINDDQTKRNLQWTVIFDDYVEQSNSYCVFIYDRHHFTKRTTIGNNHEFFMSADAHCKFETCKCRFHAILRENGKLSIDYRGNIVHRTDETHARPYRAERREKLQEFTSLGVTPGSLYLQQLKAMSTANKEAGNRNKVGSSPSVIRKISSESNVKLKHDVNLEQSLRDVKTELAKKIFPIEQVAGYLQEINTDPLRLVCYTAGGLALYRKFASTMPLSWDATGGIVINRNKRIYYYELTMSNIIRKGPSFPVSVMLSESHGTMDIVQWMTYFIGRYKQVYGYKKPFPKPPVIHSDRALVFLIAGIQIFNNDETMDRYIERCWRIVQRTATKLDLELTVVHACLGHMMKNVKKHASKDLSVKQVPFGMWLMALLVNSNTLEEMSIVWRNICIVLISRSQNDQFKISLSTLSKMADDMNKDPDKTNFVLQNMSVTSKGQCHGTVPEEMDTQEDIVGDMGVGEEEAVLSMESSFKELFQKIYQQSKELIKQYDSPLWEKLPSNPLFSATYLQHLLKLYMPTAPLWSNLLLGNFMQRYGYASTSTESPCFCHFGRTTGVSESQMRVLKQAVLSNKVYSRVDQVVSKIGGLIEAIEIQFADYASSGKNKMRILPAKKQKSAEESWSKRKKTSRTTGVYTSEKPPINLVRMMNIRLLGQNDDSNLATGQLEGFLRFENKENNCWLNSMLQMLLASGNIVETMRQAGKPDVELTSSNIIVVAGIMRCLLEKHKNARSVVEKSIVSASFIHDHIGYLRWAGIQVRSGKQSCLFDFFTSAITPTLLHHDIKFQFIIDVSVECSSCEDTTKTSQQTWDYLLVPQTFFENTLEKIVADLFGRTLEKKVCPKCFDDNQHYSSLSLMNCPKNLFIRFDPVLESNNKRHKLTTHIDFAKIMSKNIIFSHSYTRYTLQSFVTFYGSDNKGHFVTFAQKNEEWYRLDDTNITLVRSSSLFGDQAEDQPILLAHFTRPSDADIFSTALWNVFTNFSPINVNLPPSLSLNDAVIHFGKYNVIDHNPLNLAVIKSFLCSTCKTETYVVERLHDVWEMNTDTKQINAIMASFFYRDIKCSSCPELGLTNAVIYDIPKYLVLACKSNDARCSKLIDEVDLLTIQPSLEDRKFGYTAHTTLIVLDNDEVFYLRKTPEGFFYHNKVSGQFEILTDITAQYTGLASQWTIFIYETDADIFAIPTLVRATIDQNSLQPANEPEVWSIGTVQGLLPSFKKSFEVGNVIMTENDIKLLLDKNGDLNDLLIDGYLSILASLASSKTRILSVQTHLVSRIIQKQLNKFDKQWLNFDMILCPINQNHHWYLIIIDMKNKLVVELDSLSTHTLPRRRNIARILRTLAIQHYFQNKIYIDFAKEWKQATPTTAALLQQQDTHSCGVHLLVQAHAYIKKQTFANITSDNVQLRRYQLAETILRNAMPIKTDSDYSGDGLIEPSPKIILRMKKSDGKYSTY